MARAGPVLALVLLLSLAVPSVYCASDLSCTLCEAIFNEVEGLIAENQTESHIADILESEVCVRLPGVAKDMCGLLADNFLPFIISRLEQHMLPADACVEFKLCEGVPPPHTDPEAVNTYVVDLDLPPQERFAQVCGDQKYIPFIQGAISWLKSWVPIDAYNKINATGDNLARYLPYPFADEIIGCAQLAGIPVGDLVLLNLAYEWTDSCTSIVAQNPAGVNFHVRNLDFGFLAATTLLRNLAVQLNFTRGGVSAFSAASFVGYVGVLSGAKPGVVSLSLNTRMMTHPILQLIDIYVDSITQKGYSLVSFLSRSVVENATSFTEAQDMLTNTQLIADVYYIIGEGVTNGRGCVIARNQTGAVNTTCIAPPSKWYVVQTNYDWWGPVPWYDDRMVPATQMMNAMGADNISFANFFGLLSTRPVFNQLTAFTAFALPANGTYQVLQRWCNDPCPF